jgi:hypothetical protein
MAAANAAEPSRNVDTGVIVGISTYDASLRALAGSPECLRLSLRKVPVLQLVSPMVVKEHKQAQT